MFRLELLGSASIVGGDGPLSGRIAQRRHIALLAVLALDAKGTVSRDKLTALFWPEYDTERARQYLATSVYVIRQALGQDALISAGDDLRLNPDLVRSDVADFESALKAGELGRAVAIYRGPLLEGFHIRDAPELDLWLDSERIRLHQRYTGALQQLAERASAASDHAGARKYWQQLITLEPLNSRFASGFMQACAASGDPAAALQHARTHELLLREELDVAPDAAVLALAQQLRSASPIAATVVVAAPPEHVAADDAVESAAAPNAPPRDTAAALPAARAQRSRIPGVAAAVAAVLLLSGLAVIALVRGRSSAAPSAAAVAPTLAVLYLDNISRDTSTQYLAHGLTEEISSRLSHLGWLRVKSQNSVRHAQARARDASATGKLLGVRYLVEGGVRRVGDSVRVSMHLTDAADGFRVWSQDYNVAVKDLLALEQRIALRIAEHVGGQLRPWDEQRLAARITDDPYAYEQYLRGNYYLTSRTPRGVQRAAEAYQAALASDPAFTAAKARIAYAYSLFVDWGWTYPGLSRAELQQRGLSIAREAIAEDSTSAEAWLAYAYVLVNKDVHRLGPALRAFERALALGPNNAEAHHQYAQTLMIAGRDDEALNAYARAIAIEPQRPMTLVPMFAIHLHRRNIREARRWLDSAIATDPGVAYPRTASAVLHLVTRDYAAALDAARTAIRLDPSYPLPGHALSAAALARLGNRAEAERELRRAMALIADPRAPSSTEARMIVPALIALNRKQEAIDFLERVQPRGPWLWFYVRGPDFDELRADPRFRRIVEQADHVPF